MGNEPSKGDSVRLFKYWISCNNGDFEVTVTEEDIRRVYFPCWKNRSGSDSFEQCLEDWIIINWAEEIT